MKAGLDCRENAMRRIGKENITELLDKIDEDIERHPEFYGVQTVQEGTEEPPKVNSGLMNGSNPIEEVRKEMTGGNGGVKA